MCLQGCFDFLVIIHYSCSVSITLPNELHKHILSIETKHTRITTCITQYYLCLTAQYLILQKARIVSASTLRNLYLLFQVCRKRSIYVLYEFIKYSIGTFVDIH